MAANLAIKQENTVGCAYLHNNKNTVVLQNSSDCENWDCEHIVVTPFTTLTTAPYEAETRMNRGFAGGGVSNFKPHKAFKAHEVYSYTQTSAKEVQSTPVTSSRNSFDAIHHICRFAGSQTKIRHKLKGL